MNMLLGYLLVNYDSGYSGSEAWALEGKSICYSVLQDQNPSPEQVAYSGTWVTAHTAPSKYLIYLHPSNWEWQLPQQFWRFCPENNCGLWQFCPKKITECIPASVLLWNRDQLRLCLQCFKQKVEGQKWRWQKINIHKWEEFEERFNLQHVFMTNLTTTTVKIELTFKK